MNWEKQDLILAQALFRRMQVEASSNRQLEAAASLFASARLGHLCLFASSMAFENFSSALLQEGSLSSVPNVPIIRQDNRYYLRKNFLYENHLLEHCRRLYETPLPDFFDQEKLALSIQELKTAGVLTESQAEAISFIAKRSFSCLCGGPGTGKTYTAGHLIRLFFAARKQELKPKMRLCIAAPTGKAAFHLRSVFESQGALDPAFEVETATLHRLLRQHPGLKKEAKPKYSLDADVVLIDEASMVDIPLLARLLSQIGQRTILILIGDPDQLPPVNAGGLFKEMASHFGAFLKQSMRIDDHSLYMLADTVKRGDADAFLGLLPQFAYPSLFSPNLKEIVYKWIAPYVHSEMPDPNIAFAHYGKRRLLNAMRQGPYGSDYFNQQLFSILCSVTQFWAVPILAIANDPHEQLYNGVGGILIGKGKEILKAYFPDLIAGGLKQYRTPPPYEIAFCLSIHKSQGSEFQEVLALFPEGSENFGKEALYTAITRVKKRFQYLGSDAVMNAMISRGTYSNTGFSFRWNNTTYQK